MAPRQTLNQEQRRLLKIAARMPLASVANLGSIPVATVFNVNRNKRLLAVSYRTTGSRV